MNAEDRTGCTNSESVESYLRTRRIAEVVHALAEWREVEAEEWLDPQSKHILDLSIIHRMIDAIDEITPEDFKALAYGKAIDPGSEPAKDTAPEEIQITATGDQWRLMTHALTRWSGNSKVVVGHHRKADLNAMFDKFDKALGGR